jgi:hypothetical protein
MSANLFPDTPNGNDFVDGMGVVFERDKLLAGQPARTRGFIDTLLGGNLLPADYDGPPAAAPSVGSPNPFVAPHPTQALLRIRRFAANWSGANATLSPPISLSVGDYDPSACNDALTTQCVPQPGTSVRLDPIDYDQYMYRAAYRNFGDHESLMVTETVNVDYPAASIGRAGIHWYELRGVTGPSPTVFQEGTFAPADTVYRWLPSAAMDKAGNIAVGYNVSNGTSVYPGLRYSGRTVGAALGTFNVDETILISGGGSKTANNVDGRARWGDYGSITVDPVDDCTGRHGHRRRHAHCAAPAYSSAVSTARTAGCPRSRPAC